jgi:magnesium-transporting ATPase (P-type)
MMVDVPIASLILFTLIIATVAGYGLVARRLETEQVLKSFAQTYRWLLAGSIGYVLATLSPSFSTPASYIGTLWIVLTFVLCLSLLEYYLRTMIKRNSPERKSPPPQ